MEDFKQRPNGILRNEKSQYGRENKGRLKIFFGYASGVGKTYAMLKAAHSAKSKGVDVVLGYIEPNAHPETAALCEGIEGLTVYEAKHNGITLEEFDLDAALNRKPRLILVDELAHTNADKSRHAKRFQDIEELLEAGIDVYTTLNVQNIESLNDTVASITGIVVNERIPDSIFDNASQVEFVDIEPSDLTERLNAGNVYSKEQTGRAANGFFTIENLTALREIAMRRCADRVNIISERARLKNNADYRTDEHILVCLSSAPSNAKIIRTAAKMANAFHSEFTALFVETPDFQYMSAENKGRLRQNISLAKQLGAKIETVYGEDVPFQISEFSRLSGVTKIVIGRSSTVKKSFLSKPTLTEKLIAYSPNLDIHIIPDNASNLDKKKRLINKSELALIPRDILISILSLVIASCVGVAFDKLGFSDANIITVYILGVLITAVTTTHRVYSLVSSIVSVIVFNYLFTYPRFTLLAYDKGYPVTFFVMFIAAFITGSLAVRLKNNAKQSARAAFRTRVLFETNQAIQQNNNKSTIVDIISNQLVKLLGRNVILYSGDENGISEPKVYSEAEDCECEIYKSENEKAVAEWVFKNKTQAGAATQTLSDARCTYYPVKTGESIYAVVGVDAFENPIEAFESSILNSILGECALALENERNAKEKIEATILAKNEQLRANLLRSISHDLRTPLTSISGNASNLMSNGNNFDDKTKIKLYTDIYDDSMWLINLVENLLSVTRIEQGQMRLNINTELLSEVVDEALRHTNRKSAEHKISVETEDELMLVKIDARLIVQVVINIVDNAIKYTPEGSEIKIYSKAQNGKAVVTVSDNGGGISDEMKPHIFEMFYSGANKVADSRRSMGLGLALCKTIINAHGGEISVSDNNPHGCIFKFTLPLGEVNLNE
ncbi:MAG: ATP-binding protein [Eubacterium sp.]